MKRGIDYIGISVSYFCHDGKGNYVMSLRGKNCRDEHGTWDFGGGSVEFGDTIEETLKKEIKEEYGADIYRKKFLGHIETFREHEGEKMHWIHFHYLVQVHPEEVINGEPHKFDDIGWFRLDALPTPLHSAVPEILTKYKERMLLNT
ncbi:MAG: NUDIX domain-containing protein [Candidatus Pacebacteria bacterium]|nr:NUDIX domain-containing protein [Candidatus Paceibacterota bacterium]